MPDCPDCQRPIADADLNVAANLALCRACGKAWSLSSLAEEVADPGLRVDARAADGAPPRGVTLTPTAGGVEIRVRRWSKMMMFLVPFLLVHGGAFGIGGLASWGLIPVKMSSKGGSPWVFGIIGTAIGLVEMTALVALLLGRRTITVDGESGSVAWGVGPLQWRRPFVFNAGTRIGLEYNGSSVNNRRVPAVCIRNGGERVAFGAFLPDEVKQYLVAALRTVQK